MGSSNFHLPMQRAFLVPWVGRKLSASQTFSTNCCKTGCNLAGKLPSETFWGGGKSCSKLQEGTSHFSCFLPQTLLGKCPETQTAWWDCGTFPPHRHNSTIISSKLLVMNLNIPDDPKFPPVGPGTRTTNTQSSQA